MANGILFVSPHTDDIELGCGGSIRRFVENKREVFCVVLSDCRNAIPEGFEKDTLNRECNYSLTSLGVKKSNISIFQIVMNYTGFVHWSDAGFYQLHY